MVRAQGLTGFVSVEYRTVDGTAKSVGKVPPDYLVSTLLNLGYSFYCWPRNIFLMVSVSCF